MTVANGLEIVVHDLGGEGAPLLMAHATGFHGLVWQPMARRLCEHFQCVSLDHRGHGDSSLTSGPDFDWRGFAFDVLAVVQALGLERPWGVGHSSGATALLLAEQVRSGTFEALYCYEPVMVTADPPLGRDPDNWLAIRARRRQEIFASRQDAYAHYLTKSFATLDPVVLRSYVDYGFEDLADGSVRLKCRGENEAVIYEMASAHDCFARLDEVSCPVTLAFGATSEAFGPRQARELDARLTRARTEVLPDLGHLGPLQDPEAVARSVLGAFAAHSEPAV